MWSNSCRLLWWNTLCYLTQSKPMWLSAFPWGSEPRGVNDSRFSCLNPLLQTDPGTVSAAAAVSASSSKVLMAGRPFFFLYLHPQDKCIALPEGPVSGDLSFLITALVPKWRERESGIYEWNIDFEILHLELLSSSLKRLISTLFYDSPVVLFIHQIEVNKLILLSI